MKASILAKLESLGTRHEEVGALLSDPEIIADQARFRALSMEYAQLEPVAEGFESYRQALRDLEAAWEMAADEDPEMRILAQEEVRAAEARQKLNT